MIRATGNYSIIPFFFLVGINVINKNQIGYIIGLNSKTTALLPDNKHWTAIYALTYKHM